MSCRCTVAFVLFTFALAVAAAQVDDTSSAAKVGSDGVQRVEMVGGDYFFKPRRIVVVAGAPVELTVRLEAGIAPHNFVLKAPEAGIQIEEELSRDPRRITFTPTAAGTYTFYCENRFLMFRSHRERGMEGVLEVVLR